MQKPNVIEELSFEKILAAKKAKLQELDSQDSQNLATTDPAIQLLEVASYSEGLLRNRINSCVLACTVQYASSADLDNLAAFYGITRKLIKPADKNTQPPQPAIYENDNDLRKRVLEAPLGFSVAGPRSSYIYHGKLASEKVKDISAQSAAAGEVEIRVLSYDGNGLATEELLNKVTANLNDEDVRPLGDRVTIKPAEIIEFKVELEVTLSDPNHPDSENILKTIKDNIQNYVDSLHVIGGEVAKSGIYAAAHLPTVVKEIMLTSPQTNIKTSIAEAPYCSAINVTRAVVNMAALDTTITEVP